MYYTVNYIVNIIIGVMYGYTIVQCVLERGGEGRGSPVGTTSYVIIGNCQRINIIFTLLLINKEIRSQLVYKT